MGRRKDLGEHRDESTSFRGTRFFFHVIFLAIVCRDLFGYISSSMQGNGKEDGREILRTIYDGGSNMIFDREKISGFEWI